MPLHISLFNTQTMHIKSILHNSITRFDFLRTWRDSNPGLLFLRRIQCRLRNAARATSEIFANAYNMYVRLGRHLQSI
jgi:hypothetical protein